MAEITRWTAPRAFVTGNLRSAAPAPLAQNASTEIATVVRRSTLPDMTARRFLHSLTLLQFRLPGTAAGIRLTDEQGCVPVGARKPHILADLRPWMVVNYLLDRPRYKGVVHCDDPPWVRPAYP